MNSNSLVWQPVPALGMRFAIESDDALVLTAARQLFAPWIVEANSEPVTKSWRLRRDTNGWRFNDQTYALENALAHIEYGAIGHLAAHLPPAFIGLHGALLSRDFDGKARGVLVVGPKEAGKSTLACALWRAGWHLHYDDLRTRIGTARALKAPELRVLRPEALVLHTLMHSSKHVWSHGLKAAYDIAWVCERFPDFNWHWLSRLVARTGMKRGFWVPLTALGRELELPIPASFMKRAPDDKRQRRLENIARRHLFMIGRSSLEANAWVCHVLFALQSDSWLHRARHCAGLLRDVAALKGQPHAPDDDSPGNEAKRRAHRNSRLATLREGVGKWRRL